METTRGTMRKTQTARPPIVRLMSTAEETYVRPLRSEPPAGVIKSSNYGATFGALAADKELMLSKCKQARSEGSRSRMVKTAAASISLDTLDEIQSRTADAVAAELETKAATALAATQRAEARATPFIPPGVTDLAVTLSNEPRHPASQVMTQQFFSLANQNGQTSEMGVALISGYWVAAAAAGNTQMAMGKPASKFAPGGYRLHNHNHM
jgi:hypothetical protein